MKRDLILIRHTKSSWADFSTSDFERPLKKSRIDDAKRMAEKLKDLNLNPDLIICSPALRTRQTAAYFCDNLSYELKKVKFDKRLYESSAEEYLLVIRETEPEIKTLTVIGHNPSITDFANLFLKMKIGELPTTGVIWLEFESNDWDIYPTTPAHMKYLLAPKTI